MIEAAMALVFFACAIYMVLPAYVINIAQWVAVLGLLSFGALVSFTIFVNQYHLYSQFG